jgi:hypothetical protein
MGSLNFGIFAYIIPLFFIIVTLALYGETFISPLPLLPVLALESEQLAPDSLFCNRICSTSQAKKIVTIHSLTGRHHKAESWSRHDEIE